MKEQELRQHTTCSVCKKKVLATGVPLFWRVTVERFWVDVGAVKRQDGLGAFLGSSQLAAVMGTDEDLAKPMMEPATLTVCNMCACLPQVVAVLVEDR